ncbi:MAG: Ig-like domain repeat protein [Pseudonocardiaceae bacterium]
MPSTFGETVTFTATVTVNPPGAGTPTGNVVFNVDGTDVSTSPLPATAPFTVTYSTDTLDVAGSPHTVIATYSGDTNFIGSNATVSYTVNQAATTTTLTASP